MKKGNTMQLLMRIKTLFRYVFDKEVPFYKKITILLGFGYLLFPFDIIPDPILGFGIIDDITILFVIFHIIQKELDKYENKLSQKKYEKGSIIEDVTYTVKNEDRKGK